MIVIAGKFIPGGILREHWDLSERTYVHEMSEMLLIAAPDTKQSKRNAARQVTLFDISMAHARKVHVFCLNNAEIQSIRSDVIK